MTIFHFGSKPNQTHEQFFQQLIDAGEAVPDPGWEYSHLWAAAKELTKSSEDLRALIAQFEERSADSDEAIREKLQLIQTILSRAIEMV